MIFQTLLGDVEFELEDEWWSFCEMESFNPESPYYPYNSSNPSVEIVQIESVKPPTRNPGVHWFYKNRMVAVLMAFTSPECALPAVPVKRIRPGGDYSFELTDGFHRYYASVAVGYTHLPVTIRNEV